MSRRPKAGAAAETNGADRVSAIVPHATDTATATRCPAIPELWCASFTPEDRDHHGVPWCCRGRWEPGGDCMRPPTTGPVYAVRWHRPRRYGTEMVTRLFRQRPAAERFAERMDDEGRGPVAVYVADLDRWQVAR